LSTKIVIFSYPKLLLFSILTFIKWRLTPYGPTDPLHISIWKILHFYSSFSLNPSKSAFFHALTLSLLTCCLLFLNSVHAQDGKNIIFNKTESFIRRNTSDHACQIFCSKSNCETMYQWFVTHLMVISTDLNRNRRRSKHSDCSLFWPLLSQGGKIIDT
jgi:hypothetical protein